MTETNSVPTAMPEDDVAVSQAEATASEKSATSKSEPTLAELFAEISRKGAKRELALISDNPDSSADVLLVRGTFGQPEAYWFKVTGGIMAPSFAPFVMSHAKITQADLKTDAGVYAMIANACAVAACFQSDIPGVQLCEAFIAPFDYALPRFAGTHPVTHVEPVIIKRASNCAYKYRRKLREEQEVVEAAIRNDLVPDEEENISNDDINAFFAEFGE